MRNRKAAALLSGTIAFVLNIAAGAAVAAPSDWSSVAAGCVPTGQTTQMAVHSTTAGRVSFNSSATGSIVLNCPITHAVASSNHMAALYADPDGTGSGSQVQVSLRRMSQTTGSVTTVATLNSNTIASTTLGRRSVNIGGCEGHVFDHNQYYYFVQITLSRTVGTSAVAVYGVHLRNAIC